MSDKERIWLLEEKYNNKETKAYFKDVARLEEGEPLDYIIGSSSFLGTTISLKRHPLIPRVETEYWVELAIQKIKKKGMVPGITILDLFSGSGCIGVALLKHLHHAHVDFGELDRDCLKQIAENLALNSIIDSNRYNVFETDVFSHVDQRYNYIFANPPYIPLDDKVNVQSSVLNYEPHMALFAEDNGLHFIKEVLVQAPRQLHPEGTLYLEYGSMQIDAINEFIHDAIPNLYADIRFVQDQYDRPRVLEATV